MRLFPPTLLALALLAACAGQLRDQIGPRAAIIAPQLPRYGLDLRESRCLSESLGKSLTPLQLRLLARSAAGVRRGFFYRDRLTIRDFTHIASFARHKTVPAALAKGIEECEVAVPPVPNAVVEAPVELPGPAAPEVRPPAWINLGAAESSQMIAIDASTVEQVGLLRQAWFRLTNPGQAPAENSYLLQVDCSGRTINALARRKLDAAGAEVDKHEYGEAGDGPMPVEKGTVMEIAYLSLCT